MQKVHFPMKDHKSVFIEPFEEGKPAGSEGGVSCRADISLDDLFLTRLNHKFNLSSSDQT